MSTASVVRSELGHVMSTASVVRSELGHVMSTASVVRSELGHVMSTASVVRSELGHVMSAILYSQCSQVRVGTRHVCRITQPVVPVAGVWLGQLALRSGRGWDTLRIPPSHAAGGLAATQLCGCSLRTVPLSGRHQ